MTKFVFCLLLATSILPTSAFAQLVTSQPNPATRANGNVTVKPAGDYLCNSDGDWKLVVRFGTLNANGEYQDFGENNQEIFAKSIKVGMRNIAAYTGVQIVLVNAPANLIVRAELQKKGWLGYYTVTTSSYLIP